MVETPEERKVKQIRAIMNEEDPREEDTDYEQVSFVLIPSNTSLPLRELTVTRKKEQKIDALLGHLKVRIW